MKGIKWNYFGLSILLLVSVLGGLFATTSKVSAASPFDNTIGTTDVLQWSAFGNGYTLPSECANLPTKTWNYDWEDLITTLLTEDEVDYGEGLQGTLQYNGYNLPNMYSAWTNKTSFSVSQYMRGNDYGYSNQISITYTTEENSVLSFATLGGANRLAPFNQPEIYQLNFIFDNQSESCNIGVNGSYSSMTGTNINTPVVAWSEDGIPTWKIYFASWEISYPEGYEGIIPPSEQPEDPTVLTPELSYQITSDGYLKLSYLKNISPFLMGAAYIVVNEMDSNWEELGAEVINDYQIPYGTLDYDTSDTEGYKNHLDEPYQFEPGYYMIRVSYSQDFNLPWQPPYPFITNVWIQFQYDGHTSINGTTTGCGATICNEQRSETSSTWDLFNALDGLNTYGLSAFLTAPITFLQTLPSKVDNCSPISFPLFGQTITIPCLKSMYFDWSTTVMTIYTVIFNATVVYLVAFNIFRTIKNINSPHKDQIEVAHL